MDNLARKLEIIKTISHITDEETLGKIDDFMERLIYGEPITDPKEIARMDKAIAEEEFIPAEEVYKEAGLL